MKREIEFIVPDSFDGAKLGGFLRTGCGFSAALLTKCKKSGLFVNGEPVYVSRVLQSGDTVRAVISDESEQSENIKPSDEPINIVFENDDVLVVDKPYNMPTHPSHGHYLDTLANAVVGHYARLGISFRFRCVTRLDRETSGLCVIAKNSYAHDFLIKRLHTDEFVREYLALVSGVLNSGGVIDAPICREKESVILRTVSLSGERARTAYQPIEHFGSRTLLRLRLYTGRTHQIRVHTKYIGSPVVGDTLYRGEKFSRLMLHSAYLKLPLPFENRSVNLESPENKNFRNLCAD